MIAVKPKKGSVSSKRRKYRYIPGRDKSLTANPPLPLLNALDDELLLRGMALRWDAQIVRPHLGNYLGWLGRNHITPEHATREQIREYLVKLA